MACSPQYSAPEVIQGGMPTSVSSLWTIGVIAYKLLMGEMPFSGDSVDEIVTEILSGEPYFDKVEGEDLQALFSSVRVWCQ